MIDGSEKLKALQWNCRSSFAVLVDSSIRRWSSLKSYALVKFKPYYIYVRPTYALYGLRVPVVPSHVHSINDSVTAEEPADKYTFIIRQLVKRRTVSVSDISDCPKFDLILLGMGHDGHVASPFPNHAVLDEKDEWVTFITDSPEPPLERITLTLPVINSASNLAIVVTGESKAEAVHLAIDNIGRDSPSLPARLVQPVINSASNVAIVVKGKLVWFLDKPAASKLDGLQFSE
ncbi:probable 6-phosphogluconolactonase 2 [Hibiscus syriacus]|uniref:probable 6-phosphogluconolactonase 2 n=1 Tax=Hibiscus syriacus TaxID=106335 RepID=UPI0019220208|nr:probable 6-phosphogluconolactonase 2 [Hibiscus syriacus]